MNRLSIESAVKIQDHELRSKVKPEHLMVTYSETGIVTALKWKYGTDSRVYKLVKNRGGVWNPTAGGWMFDDPQTAQHILDEIVKMEPDWPIIGHASKLYLPLHRIQISRLRLSLELEACLVPLSLPNLSSVNSSARIYKLTSGGKEKKEIALMVGSVSEIAAVVESMIKQGALCDDNLANQWTFENDNRKLQVTATGWAVKIQCDRSNLRHYFVAPTPQFRYVGAYPYGTRVNLPWDGTINTTRKHWPEIKDKLQSIGLEWEGDDPEKESIVPTAFNSSRVSGWESPAPNGYMLHEYQKDGVRFCASRGMRALVGDEMGVGKTVQAIAAAEAVNAPKIIVICPANARYVWEREIQGWGGRGGIQHVMSQNDKLDMSCRWLIITYDLIAAREEIWRLNDANEERAFLSAYPDQVKLILKKLGGGYPHKVKLDKLMRKVPDFNDRKRLAAWNKMMQRIRGDVLEQILSVDQLLTILDEAHRLKNKDAKRTRAIAQIAAKKNQMLMLTGTPLRNNEHEAAVLLGLLDVDAATALSKKNGYTIQDVKDYLGHLMIRRMKVDVLPELPIKTRQRIDLGNLDSNYMLAYDNALEYAQKCYRLALKKGETELKAQQAMQGGLEQARTALGMAKVCGGEVLDLVLDVVENKGCCVIFCAHHQVSDELLAQLLKQKARAAIVDSRTPQKERAQIVKDFENGHLHVFIGGINAAGEAITLTRSDTVIFVELDWVPAALLQAEDRIHRVGQRRNCQIIQLVARMHEGDNNLDEMMVDLIGSKMARIGNVLNEDTDNIISGSSNIQAKLYKNLLLGF
jgi:superfamily II DNA or RNA helicase